MNKNSETTLVKLDLSIIILTQNESSSIERCLNSIRWCDDIILIDNSSDDTLHKAHKLLSKNQLRVFRKSEAHDFAALRNFGLKKAKHEWILFLDADEEVSQKLCKELDSRLLGNDNRVNGYYLKRKDYFLGKWLRHGETGNIKLLKLGKKSAGVWQRRVHETWQINGSIQELTSPLLHYPHPTTSEFLSHINRWTTLDAQEFYAQGRRVSFWEIVAYPTGKFLQNYLIKLGFLDGMPGLILALMMSFHSFLTRAKLYLLENYKGS
ncbi:glycosyltransferase family 2 protein [Candidatus Microgenomates bacterium]|nr:MAG: glycosyltransferase family 2 protein [Candidatus Microgenomates bacterium]